MQIIAYLVVAAITAALAYLLAPKPEKAKPALLEDFDIPTADEGEPIPVIFGTVTVKSSTVVWYGDFGVQSYKPSGSGKTPTQYKYWMGMHLAICHAATSAGDLTFLKFIYGDKDAWSGSITSNTADFGSGSYGNPTSFPSYFKDPDTGIGKLYISQPNLHGGEEGEGGFEGSVDILFGLDTQTICPYLQQVTSADSPEYGIIPAYRGVFSLAFNKSQWTANTTYIKAGHVKVKRIFSDWNPTYATCSNGGMNPAHIIYECLTNTEWGMGYPATQLDDATFDVVAQALHAEGFGLCFNWSNQDTIQAFIQIVLDHVAGVVNTSPTTGEFVFTLIRDGYDIDNLPVFDTTNIISFDSYQRQGWGDTSNEVIVTFYDQEENKERSTAPFHDIGNIQAQGGVVTRTQNYPGIPNEDLANEVATRDLKSYATPLSKIQITVDRSAYALQPGLVMKLSWEPLGIVQQIYRIVSMDYGTLEDGKIQITAIEDIFGAPQASYIGIQAPGWQSPNNPPVAALNRFAFEYPYWFLNQRDLLPLVDEMNGYVATLAASPLPDAFGYSFYGREGTVGDFEFQDKGDFTTALYLLLRCKATDTQITILDIKDFEFLEVGDIGIINQTEIVQVTDIDFGDGVQGLVDLDRGLMDTRPREWLAPTTAILFFKDKEALTFDEHPPGEYDLKMLTVTSIGQLAEADAPTDSVDLDSRALRPYPPAYLTINSENFPVAVWGEVTLAWKTRNRLNLAMDLLTEADASETGETNQDVTVYVYGEQVSGATSPPLVVTETGISAETWTYDLVDEMVSGALNRPSSYLKFEVKSQRDGYESFNAYEMEAFRESFDGDFNLTETASGGSDIAFA